MRRELKAYLKHLLQYFLYNSLNLMRRELKDVTPDSFCKYIRCTNLMRRELKACRRSSYGPYGLRGESHEERIESDVVDMDEWTAMYYCESHEERIERSAEHQALRLCLQ